MNKIIKAIRETDSRLCEKYPFYERVVNLWGLEQKFDIALIKKFPSLSKHFTDEITIKRFSDSQRAELQKIRVKK
jgi:hypothetical protein